MLDGVIIESPKSMLRGVRIRCLFQLYGRNWIANTASDLGALEIEGNTEVSLDKTALLNVEKSNYINYALTAYFRCGKCISFFCCLSVLTFNSYFVN
jgi:hypothetical protein